MTEGREEEYVFQSIAVKKIGRRGKRRRRRTRKQEGKGRESEGCVRYC